MPIFQHNFDDSKFDDAYLALMAKPTNDEVGADIDVYGHVPVTAETATQDPFTQKGSLANALDEITEPSEADEMPKEAPPQQTITAYPELKEVQTGELTGEIEGVEANTKMGEDKEVSAKESLESAFKEAFVMDDDEMPSEDEERANEEWLKKSNRAPKIPESMRGEEKPDENGLVYVTRTFTVDPEKYMSPNYRPLKDGKPVALPTDKPFEKVEVKEEVEVDSSKTPEPTPKEEKKAATEANQEMKVVEKEEETKTVQDKAEGSVVLDYATYIDGSSFVCFDEVAGIDYSKIAMDAGPKKKITRENCATTFAQCRAKNPLFCRFHGPKLLEHDIKVGITRQLKDYTGGAAGFTISVTKDKGAPNPMTFRVTIGCAPKQKKEVERILDQFLTLNPGISTKEKLHENDIGRLTQEFEMDILRADKPPKAGDELGAAWVKKRDKALAAEAEGKKVKPMEVVGESPEVKGEAPTKEAEEPEPSQKETAETVEETKEKEEIEQVPPTEEKPEEEEPPQQEEKAEETKEVAEEPSGEAGKEGATVPETPKETKEQGVSEESEEKQVKETQPEGLTEEEVNAAAKEIAKRTQYPMKSIMRDLKVRLDGKKEVTKPVVQLVEGILPKDSAVVKEIKRLYEEGMAKGADVAEEPNETPSPEENEIEKPSGTDSVSRATVEKMAEKSLKGETTPEVRETATKIQEAVEEAKANEVIAEELQKSKKEKKVKEGGASATIVNAAIDGAIKEAEAAVAKGWASAEAEAKKLNRLNEEMFRRAEKEAKGRAAASVEIALTDMAKMIFPEDSKSTTVSEEADRVVSGIMDYTKEKGVDFNSNKILDDDVAEVKKGSDRLEALMGQFKEVMEVSGTDFQAEDIEFIAEEIKGAASSLNSNFAKLQRMAETFRKRIDQKAELAKQKRELEEAVKPKVVSGGGDSRKQIADIYKDWVEEEVPEWVNNLSDEEAAEYAGLLSGAREHGVEDDSNAFDRLEAFEEKQKKRAEKVKKEEAPQQKPKEDKVDDSRKATIDAARRLGVDAYKPDEVLQKMLDTAKAHISDPRQAQRAKDIETILADRKSKGKKEVSQEEIKAARAEQKFRERTGGETLLPSEAFKGLERDASEGLGNQLNDDWVPTKEEAEAVNTKDEMPKEALQEGEEKTVEDSSPRAESSRELILRLLREAVEGK